MTACSPARTTRARVLRACPGLAAITLAAALLGCDRGASSTAAGAGADQAPPEEPTRPAPTLTFPAEIRAPYPEVSAFLDEFLNTCLGGEQEDYAAYRRLVSRAFTPESRERFEAIYHAIESVTVESIEPIEYPLIPPPAYRVVSTVELKPERQVKLRETHRKIAILVFKEGSDWRMAPAPAQLQPQEEEPAASASAPTTSGPAYPWDEEGDY